MPSPTSNMYAPYQYSSSTSTSSSPLWEAQQARDVLAKIAKSRCVYGRGIDDIHMDGPVPLPTSSMIFSNDVTAAKNDDEVEDEDSVVQEVDTFDVSSSSSMARVGSDRDVVATPVVLEVPPRNGRLQTNDPLFQGVCLYEGCMTSNQREKVEYRTTSSTNGNGNDGGAAAAKKTSSSSWTSSLSSVFSISL